MTFIVHSDPVGTFHHLSYFFTLFFLTVAIISFSLCLSGHLSSGALMMDS